MSDRDYEDNPHGLNFHARQPSPECSDHDPNTGPGSDYCVNCGKYEPDLSPRTAADAAAPAGLDVRLLTLAAEATEKHLVDGVIEGTHPFLVADRFSWHKWAEYQAAEYARLQGQRDD